VSEDQRRPSEEGRGPRVDTAEVLRDVARSLQAEPDLKHLVAGIVAAVTETVPGAEAAGVSLWEGKVLRTVAATNDVVSLLNAIEHELGEGPCVQAVLEHRSYRIDDMSTDARWPRFASAARSHGMQSMLGFRLFTTGRNLGALDLYSSKLNAFDAEAEVVGELFAAHAAIALLGSTQQADWRAALNSRDLIGMAKGILMHRERITDDQAFTLLVTTSQRAAIKIRDLAVWLVDDANESVVSRTDS
jgi:GAF domain-containing protein